MTVNSNAIPWWTGTRKITKVELKEGAACVVELIGMLPKLRAVVMVGARAEAAKPFLEKTRLELLSSDHTGPMVRARWRERWEAIPTEWAKVRPVIVDDELVTTREK